MGGALLRTSDYRALLDAVDRLYQPVRPAEFPGHLFGVLSALLPGTLHSFDSVELATGKVESHVTPVVNSIAPAAGFEAVVREYAWQNPVVPHLANHADTVVQLGDLTSHRQFRNTDFYRHCHLPLGIRHQIAAGVARPGHAGAFVVNRGGPRPFTAREVELIARLRPHVERAFANALRLEAWQQEQARAAAIDGDIPPPSLDGFTRREQEVLHWLGVGKRNGEIASILSISPRTVEKHVEHILAKLGAETRVAAALIARQV